MDREYYREYFQLEEKHWVFIARRKISFSIMDKYLAGNNKLDILDVGTGTGVMLGALKRYGRVTGVDSSDIAIKFCQERGYSNVVSGSAENMSFENNSFDLICAMDLLEHLDNDQKALKEFYRILRPGGFLFVTVPAYMFLWGPHDEINMHKRRYRINEIYQKIIDAKFCVEKISYFNSFLFPIIAFVRLGRKIIRQRNTELKSDFKMSSLLMNNILEGIFSSERFLLKHWNLPFGVSIVCLAIKRT